MLDAVRWPCALLPRVCSATRYCDMQPPFAFYANKEAVLQQRTGQQEALSLHEAPPPRTGTMFTMHFVRNCCAWLARTLTYVRTRCFGCHSSRGMHPHADGQPTKALGAARDRLRWSV